MKIILLVFAFILLISSSAFGCTCFQPDSARQALKNWSDAVFMGEIIAVDGEDFTFEVERVWKGVSDKEVVVTDSFAKSSCSSELELGKQYLIFASFLKDKNKTTSINDEGKPIFHIDTCSWSTSLTNPDSIKKVIKKYGIGKGKSIN